jgi:hypothetical protein
MTDKLFTFTVMMIVGALVISAIICSLHNALGDIFAVFSVVECQFLSEMGRKL